MRTISLTQGYSTMVDDSDYDFVNQWRWYAMKDTRPDRIVVYACRNGSIRGGRKRTTILMHRVISNASPGSLVDHADGNGLNNQRRNLRAATFSQNTANQYIVRGTSRYKGVSRYRNGKWVAQISYKGKNRGLGYFKHEYNAAQAYNFAAYEFYGDFARMNTP